MIMEWKTFKIDLSQFKIWLDENIPTSDGIIATEDNFIIVETEPFTEEQIGQIQAYYDNLTEEDEQEKLNRPEKLSNAIIACKMSLLDKAYRDLLTPEKKLLLNLELDSDDEAWLLETFPS